MAAPEPLECSRTYAEKRSSMRHSKETRNRWSDQLSLHTNPRPKCGVLKPGGPLSIEQLYARYRGHTDKTINELIQSQAPTDIEERWIVKYCLPTKIKMVGVWETVGSLGSPSLKSKIVKYLFLDTHLRVQNEFAFQALAIDEQRKSFEPTLWTKTTSNIAAASSPPPRPLGEVEQRWFVGAHANVGGG